MQQTQRFLFIVIAGNFDMQSALRSLRPLRFKMQSKNEGSFTHYRR